MSKDSTHDSVSSKIEELRDRNRTIFSLCDNWITGKISADEFRLEKQTIFSNTSSLSHAGIPSEVSISIAEEFNHAASCALYAEEAITELFQNGFGGTPLAVFRARHFLSHLKFDTCLLAMQESLNYDG